MPGMDVFNANAFSMQTLTAAVNDVPFVPGRLGQLMVFEERGVRTTRISVERKGATLALIPVTQRGAPPVQNVKDRRDIRDLPTVRLAVSDEIMADEVQNVRSFGSETELQSLQMEVNERSASMARKLDATLEHHRIGAIKGQILDADLSVLLDLFSEFGVVQQPDVDFDLDNASPAPGAVRKVCSAVIRTIEDELGGIPYTGIMGLCGSTFFDDLTAHSEVRETFVQQEGVRLRERVARRALFYGGIQFEEYRGRVGGNDYIATNDCQLFPVGAPGTFITRFAPADYWETVNTIGLPRYARTFGDPNGRDSMRVLEVQSNPINICTRPRVLIRGTRT